MRDGAVIAVVIPVLNEERAIGKVLAAIPRWVDDVVVVDNGSTDGTARVVRTKGARLVAEPVRGYGAACQAGIRALGASDVVVFIDGDFSDRPEEMQRLIDPIIGGRADLVIGSRVTGRREAGALSAQQRFGNWLACRLMRWFWGARYTDLGPFRAIGRAALDRLEMRDRGFGWTVEMQVKAVRLGLRVQEVPVSYRRRIGVSKISGTLSGTVQAGFKIMFVIFAALLGR
jgi:glycosyltransferase involved in cell wall biosynthesis